MGLCGNFTYLFDEIATKQINMQRKQSHLYSEEIVYLGTRGLEVGLRMAEPFNEMKAFLAMINSND